MLPDEELPCSCPALTHGASPEEALRVLKEKKILRNEDASPALRFCQLSQGDGPIPPKLSGALPRQSDPNIPRLLHGPLAPSIFRQTAVRPRTRADLEKGPDPLEPKVPWRANGPGESLSCKKG